jgi:hypothetical protein
MCSFGKNTKSSLALINLELCEAKMTSVWTAFTNGYQVPFVRLLHRYALATLQDCADKVDEELTNDNEGLTDRKSRAAWRKAIAEVRNWDEAKWKADAEALVRQATCGLSGAKRHDLLVREGIQRAIELGITQYVKDICPHKSDTDIASMQLEELPLEDFLAFFVNAVLDQQAVTSCGIADLDIMECLRTAASHAVPARDIFSTSASSTTTTTTTTTSSTGGSSRSSKEDDDVVSVPLKAASSDDDVAEPSYAKPSRSKARSYKRRDDRLRGDRSRHDRRENRRDRRKTRGRSRSRSRSESPLRAPQEPGSIKDRIKKLAKQPVDIPSSKEAKGLDITSILDKKAK